MESIMFWKKTILQLRWEPRGSVIAEPKEDAFVAARVWKPKPWPSAVTTSVGRAQHGHYGVLLAV